MLLKNYRVISHLATVQNHRTQFIVRYPKIGILKIESALPGIFAPRFGLWFGRGPNAAARRHEFRPTRRQVGRRLVAVKLAFADALPLRPPCFVFTLEAAGLHRPRRTDAAPFPDQRPAADRQNRETFFAGSMRVKKFIPHAKRGSRKRPADNQAEARRTPSRKFAAADRKDRR